jgi:cysteine synthase A
VPVHIIHPDITSTIGRTPLVRLNRVIPAHHATVLLKLEFFNPLSSVKDRIGLAMIEAAERDQRIVPGRTHIIEPTSGNTGIALAFIAAAKGYALTLTMPESMSHERRALLRGLGANLELTPAPRGMKGAIERARELQQTTPHAWSPQQFDNPANPKVHEETTGPEIWAATGGKIDVLVAGVGTGGTITGCTRFLHTKNPDLAAVAVEPAESPVLSGGEPGPHRIQGIGAGFVPGNLDRDLLDEVERVSADEAFAWARRLAQEEGIPVGISTGANVAAAARIAAEPENRGLTIVTFAASSAERYLTTPLFNLVGSKLIDTAPAPDVRAEVRI